MRWSWSRYCDCPDVWSDSLRVYLLGLGVCRDCGGLFDIVEDYYSV